jgi:SAM-dependent methyltransferase
MTDEHSHPAALDRFTEAFWDARYSAHHHVWSGRPNARLVEHVTPLAPGRALDVGCGEGGDAIWLAERGWSVTGTDVSGVGLARAQGNAEEAGPGIAARIVWSRDDLFGDGWGPFGGYDLVTAHYLHLPTEVRVRSLERLAGAVAPGGRLLIVTHHPSDLEIPGLRPNLPELFCTPDELAAGLDASAWEILLADSPERPMTGPDGTEIVVRDAVLFARRRT